VYNDGNNKVMLVSTSAGWCSACIEEQPKLAELYREYADRGLYILITLFENADFAPADVRLAEQWKRRYDLPFTVVADPAFQFSTYYDRDATPMTMLVDVENMLILKIATGFNEPEVRAIIDAVVN
jgi:thiol-disulfide isomerase/thioredoxin